MTGPAADEAAVRAIADELYHHLEAGDYGAAARLYSDDSLFIAPGAPPANMQAFLSDLQKSPPPLPANAVQKWTIEITEVVISGDLAYERGRYTSTLVDKVTREPLPGPQAPETLFVHIFRRQPDGGWKAWRYHPTPNVTLPRPVSGA